MFYKCLLYNVASAATGVCPREDPGIQPTFLPGGREKGDAEEGADGEGGETKGRDTEAEGTVPNETEREQEPVLAAFLPQQAARSLRDGSARVGLLPAPHGAVQPAARVRPPAVHLHPRARADRRARQAGVPRPSSHIRQPDCAGRYQPSRRGLQAGLLPSDGLLSTEGVAVLLAGVLEQPGAVWEMARL